MLHHHPSLPVMTQALLIARLVAWPLLALTVFITRHTVRAHLRLGQQRPRLCTNIVRILLLPPIYALEAALSLALPAWAPLFVMFRGLCEAGVVAAFLQFLVEVLPPFDILAKHPHLFPMHVCMAPWSARRIMIGILQYTAVMAVLWPITLFAWAGNVYVQPSKFSSRAAYVYCAFVRNASQMLAMYSLLMFYRAMHRELRGTVARPWLKLACIKLIVFFTFWQSLLLAWLEHCGTIDPDTAEYLADTVVSIEMACFAGMHRLAFDAIDVKAYRTPRAASIQSTKNDVLLSANANDAKSDVSTPPSPLTLVKIVRESLNPCKVVLECRHCLRSPPVTQNAIGPHTRQEITDYSEL